VETTLRHTSDKQPGFTRVRRGKNFSYQDLDGKLLKNLTQLARIRALAIPPAYERVWICADANGHLQATGRDARGRKQYVYHTDWHASQGADKFGRVASFGATLPALRRRLWKDISLRGLPREKVLAAVCLLLDETLVRVGNEEYAQSNKSFGLTTLRNRHVRVKQAEVKFDFRGKSAVQHSITVTDPALAKIIRRCLDIPGQHLFQFIDDDGKPHHIDSGAVNLYLKAISGNDITAKDFRTWAASVAALSALTKLKFANKTEAKRQVSETIKDVAERLRNTPAVCRKSYIHPLIIEAFHGNILSQPVSMRRRTGLRADEHALLSFLTQRANSRSARTTPENLPV
jgi:DNA topoisomerase I